MEEPIRPQPLRKSIYGDPNITKKRAFMLDGIVSIRFKKIFPDMPDPIYPGDQGINRIKEATIRAIKKINLDRIKPKDSVNILASHHGFVIFGGEPYTEMLKSIKDFIENETKADVRLRVGVGVRFKEADEYIKIFNLDRYFNKKAIGISPIDEGIPIETCIGTFYLIKRAFDAKWIIHTHYTDLREAHFHRMLDRILKPFAMAYARIETRSSYHMCWGPITSNFIARAIFESPLIQEKLIFSSILKVFPTGVINVIANNDLNQLNNEVTFEMLRYYGKILQLLGTIDECIVVLDSSAPIPYNSAGGIIFGLFISSHQDIFDLNIPLPAYTTYSEIFHGANGKPLYSSIPSLNPAIKAVVINNSFIGYASDFFAEKLPVIIVGKTQADLFKSDPRSPFFMKYSVTAEDIDSAMEFAYKIAKTKKVIIFDGVSGGINVSEPLGKYLTEKAQIINEKVEKELLPKWLRQRGLI
jgi:hypothetical protein